MPLAPHRAVRSDWSSLLDTRLSKRQTPGEAIRTLESRDDIDLVFTDVQMRGTMDGIKLSHYIRDRWSPVKLIVASGNPIVEESNLPPGSRFFSKPYDDGLSMPLPASSQATSSPRSFDPTTHA